MAFQQFAAEWTAFASGGVTLSFPILIVEDHAKTSAVIATLLNAIGFTDTEHATDGDKALSRLTRGGIRLVLSDYHMSPMNGLELLQRMRANDETADIPFVMVSADQDFQLMRAAAQAHVEILIKPFKADQLRQSLMRAVGRECFDEAKSAGSARP